MIRVVIYIAQRLSALALTVGLASLLIFVGVHALPGNPFLSDPTQSAGSAAAAFHRYGLDRPILVQYVDWVSHAVRGDLGISFVNTGVELTPLLSGQAAISATLGGVALVIGVTLGLFLGVISATRRGSWLDQAISSFGVIAYSMPAFVVATLVLEVFVIELYRLTGGSLYQQIGWGTVQQVPLPAFCIAVPIAGYLARVTRAAVLEVSREDFIRTAVAKGLRFRVIAVRHLLRNALIPVISLLGPIVVSVLSGSIVIENMFGIPGLGREFVDSISGRDYNAVVGVFTIYTAIVGLSNLLVDLSYPLLDPRVRL